MVGGRILRRPGDESPEIVLSPARGVPGASNQIVRRGLSHYREKKIKIQPDPQNQDQGSDPMLWAILGLPLIGQGCQ